MRIVTCRSVVANCGLVGAQVLKAIGGNRQSIFIFLGYCFLVACFVFKGRLAIVMAFHTFLDSLRSKKNQTNEQTNKNQTPQQNKKNPQNQNRFCVARFEAEQGRTPQGGTC